MAQCASAPAFEITQHLRWVGIAHHADHDVKMIEEDCNGAQFPLSKAGRLSELTQKNFRLDRYQVDGRSFHQRARRLFEPRNVLVIRSARQVMRDARLAVRIIPAMFPYPADKPKASAWQPIAITGVGQEPITIHAR